MTWFEQFRENAGRRAQRQKGRVGPVPVNGILDIPTEAHQEDAFSLTAEVERVFERTTNGGHPCYFLHLRDSEQVRFCVVIWDWQMARFQGDITEGTSLTISVRIPKGNFSAFTLA